jgi:DNA repair protein RadA/Sms
MAKEKTHYVCTECGGSSPKWLGKCPSCNAWNTLIESAVESAGAGSKNRYAGMAATRTQCRGGGAATSKPTTWTRTPTGQEELDRVLGGGMVDGGVVLIGGDPGIGKSTLLLQAMDGLQRSGMPTLYVTGEESAAQVALRSRRLGLGPQPGAGAGRNPVGESRWPRSTNSSRRWLVMDSIQTVYSEQLTSAPARWRRCANAPPTSPAWPSPPARRWCWWAMSPKKALWPGHGCLEHMVDTVLYFEGDTHSTYRLVRAIKNRFGAVNEIGVFAMTEKGLKGVSNPSAIFLEPARRARARQLRRWSRWKARVRCWWKSRPWWTAAAPRPGA